MTIKELVTFLEKYDERNQIVFHDKDGEIDLTLESVDESVDTLDITFRFTQVL